MKKLPVVPILYLQTPFFYQLYTGTEIDSTVQVMLSEVNSEMVTRFTERVLLNEESAAARTIVVYV